MASVLCSPFYSANWDLVAMATFTDHLPTTKLLPNVVSRFWWAIWLDVYRSSLCTVVLPVWMINIIFCGVCVSGTIFPIVLAEEKRFVMCSGSIIVVLNIRSGVCFYPGFARVTVTHLCISFSFSGKSC